MIDIPVTHLGF